MTKTDAYEAALKDAAYFHQPQTGFLRVMDHDRVDFLQRQTTNDLGQLAVDRVVSTVLTSPTARILDLFCVTDEGESLGVVPLPGRTAETLKFLRGRIFFSDKVRVEDISADIVQILLVGPRVDSVLEKLDLQPPAPDHIIRWEIEDQLISVIGQKILAGIGYCLLVPVASLDTIVGVLDAAGVSSLDPETFEILRVEAGQPGPVSELVDTYTPLEVGLGKLISDSKGCYTGQEIIARQITYDKVAKVLVGIKLSDLAGAGAEIKADGKSAGILTSATKSPRFGSVGLAVVRRQYAKAGTNVLITRLRWLCHQRGNRAVAFCRDVIVRQPK